MAKGHGGNRANAGRKAVLTLDQKCAAGSEYARLARNAAMPKSRKAVVAARRRIDLIPVKVLEAARDRARQGDKKALDATLENFSDGVDDALGGARVRTARARRAYGVSAGITAQVIAWCQKQFRVTISARQVTECRNAYRAKLRRFQRIASRS